MLSTPAKHQRKIAMDTLKSKTPVMALILGGQTFEESYKVIFNTDLSARLESLIEEYGESCAAPDFSWELDTYGWTPISLMQALLKTKDIYQ